ncbi:MAG TPA: lipid-binding SYLF domain-containing protein [Blastocatellia bacterium]|nr:lipid-binding SYLF domain-containing protein [Blastocatellia bacterium]
MKGKNGRLLAFMLSPVLALVLMTSVLSAQTQETQPQKTQKEDTQAKETQAKETQAIDKDNLEEAMEESREASEVFNEIMKTPDKAIPKELLEKAEAIAVFPDVIKAALIVGGQGGDGVISRRTSSGWSAPVFFKMRGGSFGAQIGAESTDYVLLFMNEGALKGLLEDKFEIGGEVSIAAGPVGRTAAASTNVTLDAGILSYSRSKGAFIGASIKGAQISPQNDLNSAIYGMKAKDILTAAQTIDAAKVPEGVMSFTQTLTNYTKGQSSHSGQAAPARTGNR